MFSNYVGKNYYADLGIDSKAPSDDIKKAFKKLARETHPDKHVQNHISLEEAEKGFKVINEAYEVLINPDERMKFDLATQKKQGKTNKRTNMENVFFDTLSTIVLNDVCRNLINNDDLLLLDDYIKKHAQENKLFLHQHLLQNLLYAACKSGKLQIVKYLIEKKSIKPNLIVDDISSWFSGPVFKAAVISGNLDLVRYLKEEQHVDIESYTYEGRYQTALSTAAKKGHSAIVTYLIEQKANLNPFDYLNGFSILDDAISSGEKEIVIKLLNAGTIFGDWHLSHALNKGHLEIAQYFLKFVRPDLHTHDYLHSPAYSAICSGNLQLLKYLENEESLDIFEQFSILKNVEKALLDAMLENPKVDMMRYLLGEKGLSRLLNKPSLVNEILKKTIHGFVMTPLEVESRVQCLKFLVEEMHCQPDKNQLKNYIRKMRGLRYEKMIYYLQKLLIEKNNTGISHLRSQSHFKTPAGNSTSNAGLNPRMKPKGFS